MYTITRGDTVSLDLPLTIGGVPYCMGSGTNYLLTVKNSLSDPDSAAVVQKALGAGLRLNLPSNLWADFVPIDFYNQTNTSFFFDVQAQESGGAIETVLLDTLEITTDVTRLTGSSIPIYTTNPPYPGGTILTVTGSNAIYSGNLVGTDGLTVSYDGTTITIAGTGGAGGPGGTGTQLSVTGSQPLPTANLTGIGGTLVYLSGGYLIVSGGAGAGTVTQFQLDALSGFTTGISGVLASQIAGFSGGVTSLNGQSGAISLIGAGGITVVVNGQSISISGDTSISGALTATGAAIEAQIASLSGWAASATNLALTGSILDSKINALSGSDAATYATIVTTNLISGNLIQTGVQLASTIAATGQQSWTAAQNNATNLSGNMAQTGAAILAALTATGVVIEAQIVSLSGFTTGASGFLQIEINALPTAAQLTQTGIVLGAKIDALSGYDNATFATISNLALTGSNLYGLVVNESGALTGLVSQTSGVLQSGIANTGQAAWISANGAATTLSGNIASTGSILYNDLTGTSGWANTTFATLINVTQTGVTLGATIAATGSTLYSDIMGFSGQSISTYATITNLALTGSNLYNLLVNESGAILTLIASTGSQAWNAANNNGINLSGMLISTGGLLYGLINNLYNGTPSQSFQIQTGSSGIVLKNTSSGLYLRNYNDTLGGDLIVRNLTVQGTQTINNATNLAVTNQYIYLNQSGAPQDGGVEVLRSGSPAASLLWSESDMRWKAGLSGLESTIILASDTGQFASVTSLTVTGATLYTMLVNESGALSTTIALTGQQSWSAAQNNAVNLSGAVASTGSILYIDLTGLSGTHNLLIAQTGQAAWVSANGAAATLSGNATQTGIALMARDAAISGVLDVKIAATGSLLYALLTGSSGQANTNFATVANLALTGSNLYNLIVNESGALTGLIAKTSGVLQSGIALTGSLLYSDITGFSGQAGSTYATIANLALTGSNLYNLIVGESGALTSLIAQTSGVLQSAVASTGSILYIDLTGLSGQAVNTYATILSLFQTGSTLYNDLVGLSGNLIATGGLLSAVKVTGSSIIPVVNLTGLGGTLVFWSGNKVFISGAGASAGNVAGVTGLNGLTGLVTIVGTGGITVSIQGQNVLISGDNSISGALTATGVLIEAQINALSGYFTGLIPSFGSFSFLSAVPYGIDTYFVPYQNYLFTTVPIVNVTIESTTGNSNYGVSISGRTTSGFYANFTEQIGETNMLLDVFVNSTTAPNPNLFSYLTGIPTGSDIVYFAFSGMTFPSIPRVVATMETAIFNVNYPFTISGRSTSGFFALFGDQIVDSGLSLDVTVRG